MMIYYKSSQYRNQQEDSTMNFLPGSIMGFREGLEAFLIIVIILRYLTKIDQNKLKIKVYQGCIAGIFSQFFLVLDYLHLKNMELLILTTFYFTKLSTFQQPCSVIKME